MPIHAGTEIGVASTKAFIGQLLVLFILSLKLAKVRKDINENVYEDNIKNLINDNQYFEEVSTICMQKSKEYSWENTTDSLLKLYQEAKFSLKN